MGGIVGNHKQRHYSTLPGQQQPQQQRSVPLFRIQAYCNFVPIRVARNLGKPTQAFAKSTCVEISSPPTLKVTISALEVSTMASTWGRVN